MALKVSLRVSSNTGKSKLIEFYKLPHPVFLLADIDGKYLERLSSQCLLEAFQHGHFLDAGWAPAGPEVDQYYLSAVVLQAVLLSLEIRQIE